MRNEPQPNSPGSEYDDERQLATRERRRLDDDLIGLERNDPEVQAFSNIRQIYPPEREILGVVPIGIELAHPRSPHDHAQR